MAFGYGQFGNKGMQYAANLKIYLVKIAPNLVNLIDCGQSGRIPDYP